MILAEVPLKVTLFGEHAVVFNRPAIAMAITERLRVRISEGSESVVIHSPNLMLRGLRVDLKAGKADAEQVLNAFSYVVEVIRYFGERPCVIEVESPVDPSVGLGTSAAVTVGTVAAYSRFIGESLSLERIAKIAHEVELRVQGAASKMDTYTETFGGLVFFEGGEMVKRIQGVDLGIVAGYLPRNSTTKDLVGKVRGIFERRRGIVGMIMDSIGELVREARQCIEEGDLRGVGELMYINHGLLNALGVTSPEVDEMVSRAKRIGVPGCKMSGGGGGGTVICLKSPWTESLFDLHGARRVNSTPDYRGVVVKGDSAATDRSG